MDLVSLSHAFFAYAIWSLRLLKFILARLSVLIFILYCVCTNCESFKSNQIENTIALYQLFGLKEANEIVYDVLKTDFIYKTL